MGERKLTDSCVNVIIGFIKYGILCILKHYFISEKKKNIYVTFNNLKCVTYSYFRYFNMVFL